jgi:hypothetical protein
MSQPALEPASAPASAPVLRHIPRRYLALGLIIVAICLLGTLVLVRDSTGPNTSSTVETFSPAPSSLLSTMAQVPASVFNTVGVSSPTSPVVAPQPAGGGNAPMWLAANGGTPLPVVFFYGAEFAPYAGVQRWPLVLALSRFGTFTKLGLMESSATTAFANLSTFTFWGSTYSSKYLILESVERYSSLNPTGAHYLSLQHPNAREATAINTYGAGATTFAMLDVANRYVLNGSSFAPSVLAGLSQNQIAGNLDTPASPLTQAVVTSANEITASICAVDGDKPGAVCDSPGVLAADATLKITPPH